MNRAKEGQSHEEERQHPGGETITAPYSSFHPPLSFSLSCSGSLSLSLSLARSHTHTPSHLSLSLSLSLSLFITSLLLLLPLPHWAANELIAVSVCVCACVCLSWFPVTVRRGEAPIHLITWDTFHLPRPLSLPLFSFAPNVGDMRTRGRCVRPACCCSVKCIIHGMTGSGTADGGRGRRACMRA